jgi:hypothetical protein
MNCKNKGKTNISSENLTIDENNIINGDLSREYMERLLPLLEGNIFHVTTYQNYNLIKKDGAIRNNKNNQYSLASQRRGYFAQDRGDISLFDFRNIDDKTFSDFFLESYFFIFRRAHANRRRHARIIFLIIDAAIHPKIIDYRTANKSGKLCIPKIECGYPDRIEIDNIIKKINVTIITKKPTGMKKILTSTDEELKCS